MLDPHQHTLQLIDKLEKFDIETIARHEDREHFDSYFHYVLAVVGFTVGYGSFWRFPYLLYKNGGGVFLIPYISVMVVFGVPLLYLETAVGQMHQQTIPKIYEKINSGFKMFGYVVIFLAFNMSTYYNVLLTYSYRFIFTAFINPLPFINESPTQNTYFNESILHKSASIEEFGSLNYLLAFLFIMSLYICYQSIKRGLKINGRILIFTVILPYVFFFILAIRGAFLEGSQIGLRYLFQPDWSKLIKPTIWLDAVVQVFFQMSIASAGVMHFSTKKPKNQSFMSILYIIPVGLIVCGILSGLIIFMYVGHFCHQSGLEISQLSLRGLELAFNVLPKAIGILPWPNFWLLIFCVVLVLLGIDTMFGFLESVTDTLEDEYRQKPMVICGIEIAHDKIKPLSIAVIGLTFPFFCCSAGIYYLQFFDKFIVDIGLPFGVLMELYVFVYLFDFKLLEDEVLYHTKSKTPSFIRMILTSRFMVVSLIMFFILGFVRQMLLIMQYSMYLYLFGWIISAYPMVIAFMYWMRNRSTQYNFTFKPIKA